MKNDAKFIKLILKFSSQMSGVFKTADLANLLDVSSNVQLFRCIQRLEEQGVIKRFKKGIYKTEDANPQMLSQTISPKSYISFEMPLSQNLNINTTQAKTVKAIKIGKDRTYRCEGITIKQFGIAPHLFFGFENRNGILIATPEKALLDVLYFHLRGAKFSFDIYSDLRFDRLDEKLLKKYLRAYKNPKFVAFVQKLWQGRSK